jgi:predicted PurR-regulated permease PerM
VNRNWLVTAFFFALLLVILYVAVLILAPFLQAITWAAILAVIVYPVYVWLLRLLKGRATAASLLVTVLLTLLILIPAVRFASFLSDEAVEAVHVVRSLLNGGEIETWKEKPWIESLVGLWYRINQELASFGIDLKEALLQGAQFSSGFLASQIKGIAQNVFLFVVNLLIVIFTFFFFLRDGEHFFKKVQGVLPMGQEHQEQLFSNIVNAVLAVIHGCVLTAMIQGVLAGLAYWVLGVPFSILLSQPPLPRCFLLAALLSSGCLLPSIFWLRRITCVAWFLWHGALVSSEPLTTSSSRFLLEPGYGYQCFSFFLVLSEG